MSTPVRPYGGVSAADRVAARRAALLDAGLECFGTTGYADTGVKDLCRAARVTDRYFYESFSDSRALFVAVFDRVTDELFVAVAEAVAAVGSQPERQLRAAIATFLDRLASDPRKAQVVFSEAAAAGQEAAEHMRATLRRFAELVAATARPHVASDEAAHILALSLVGTLERVVVEWQTGALDLSVEAITDHCVRLYATLLRA